MKYPSTLILLSTCLLLSACGLSQPSDAATPPSAVESPAIETTLAETTAAPTETAATASAETVEPETPSAELPNTVLINREDLQEIPDGFYEYQSGIFYHGGAEWSFRIETSAVPDDQGECAFDDSNEFRIVAANASGQYVLFEDWIQLGVPEIDIFETYDDVGAELHIIVRDTRTALYRLTDFVYDAEADAFTATDILDYSGINFIGSSM